MVSEQERQNAIARAEAEIQVEAFLGILQDRYDLKSEDIREILDDLKWVRRYRTGVIRIQWTATLGILAVAISGLVAALWKGLIASIRGL